MLTITVKVDALPEQAQGVKEALAMYLEQFGDAQVVEVKSPVFWQASLFGNARGGDGAERRGARSAAAGRGRR